MALSHVLKQSDRLGAERACSGGISRRYLLSVAGRKIEVELSQGGDDNSVTARVTFVV